MELDFQIDTSWCPVCNRHILPKRYQVPVPTVEPTSPTVPLSPLSDSPPRKTDVRSNKKNTRTRGGLVHGTGRVKPNGTIRATSQPRKSPVEPPKLAPPVKHRTVIDQGPTPLYCSDECRLADINASSGVLSGDFDPERQMPPTPHNSLSSLSISAGNESDSSDSLSEPPTATSLCHAALSPFYNFPPLPPAPTMARRPSSPDHYAANNYQSGVMMAAQRIKAALCPEQAPKRPGFGPAPPPKERKPIPGWTDGSDAWRASVYSFAAPRDPGFVASDPEHDDRRAYKSFVAASHRSVGVYSTLDASYQTPNAPAPLPRNSSANLPRNKTVEELYSKYPLAMSRRSESRSSLSVSPTLNMARSLPTTVGPIVKKKEVSLLKRGAEGKLLVPDVKLKVSTSYVSVSASPSNTSSLSSSRLVRRDSARSEESLASVSESTEDEGTAASLGMTKSPRRSAVETRSWSYDNLVTYPIMQLPPKKEKRVEKRFVNGVEKEVVVEVELPPAPLKRLFLFPGKDVR